MFFDSDMDLVELCLLDFFSVAYLLGSLVFNTVFFIDLFVLLSTVCTIEHACWIFASFLFLFAVSLDIYRRHHVAFVIGFFCILWTDPFQILSEQRLSHVSFSQ